MSSSTILFKFTICSSIEVMFFIMTDIVPEIKLEVELWEGKVGIELALEFSYSSLYLNDEKRSLITKEEIFVPCALGEIMDC